MLVRILCVFAVYLYIAIAMAQVVPDAGIIQREIESSRPQTVLPEPNHTLPKTSVPDDPYQPHYLIQSFDIQGATLIDRKELLALIQNNIGQSLSAAQLQALGQPIRDHYREQGWLVRLYFPDQDLSSGVIRIEIIESRYSGSELESEDSRADKELVRNFALGGLVEGEALNIKRVESGILKANELPGIETNAVLISGEKTGETKIRLKVSDQALFGGNLNYANQGIRATGSNQYQGNFYLNDPLGRGDQLSVQALGSENMVSVRGQYGWLLGDFGTRLSIYGSHLNYQLGGNFSSLNLEGEGRIIGGLFTQNLIRSASENLNATVTLENRLNQSSHSASLDRLRDINTLALGLNGDQNDSWLTTANNIAGLQLTLGRLNIDLVSDKSTDAQSTRAQGDFVKFNFNLARTEYLNDDWQVSMAFNGQWAAKNLDSSQKFALGGPNGVRAYPINEGMGDSGWLFNIELRRNLGYGLQGFLFSDTGGIEVNQTQRFAQTHSANSYLLSGIGMGLRLNHQNQWLASATVGLPLTSNPARDIYNHNADGTRAGDPSGWLSLTRFF